MRGGDYFIKMYWNADHQMDERLAQRRFSEKQIHLMQESQTSAWKVQILHLSLLNFASIFFYLSIEKREPPFETFGQQAETAIVRGLCQKLKSQRAKGTKELNTPDNQRVILFHAI